MPSKKSVEISFTGIANFLGVVGVIGSLIFVGLELRQTQQIALAAQVQSRAEQLTDRSLVWLQGEWELGYRIRAVPGAGQGDRLCRRSRGYPADSGSSCRERTCQTGSPATW